VDALNRQFTSLETSVAWERQLERALPEFYAAIIVFSIKVKGYFKFSTIGKTIFTVCSDTNDHI
jgi:hypothetical protein